MYICRLCHAENKPTAKFCRRCGVARPPEMAAAAISAAGEVESAGISTAPDTLETGNAPAAYALNPSLPSEASPEKSAVASPAVEPVAKLAGNSCPEPVLRPARSVIPKLAEQIKDIPDPVSEAESHAFSKHSASGADSKGDVKRMSTICFSCNTPIRALDKFCIWCGQRQPERHLPPAKKCAECSTHLPLNANFCFVCGSDAGTPKARKVRVPTELFLEEDPELFPTFES